MGFLEVYKTIDRSEYLDVYKACEKYGFKLDELYRLVRRGYIRGKMIDGLLHVGVESIEKYLKYRKKEEETAKV